MSHSIKALTGALIAAAMTAGGTVSAQEALGTRAPLVSPAVNADGTVIFTLPRCEGDSAATLVADCIAGGRAAMTAVMLDSVTPAWRYTAGTVSPGLYSYHYEVDGHTLLDPSNVHTVRDVATLNSLLLIAADNGPEALYTTRRGVPHGTVSLTWLPQDGRERRATIYTPPGYKTEGDRRYPVLYLLHGMGGDETAWSELGRAAEILDNLIATGEAEPMIVVMPNGNIAMDAAPGVYAGTAEGDTMEQPVFNLPRTMDGGFESTFGSLVDAVDSRYRTIADRDHRAIAGLSMGGFHSMIISRDNPDTYGWIGLFSAATDKRVAGSEAEAYADADGRLRRLFDRKPHLYYIAIGRDDFLYDDNREYRTRLDSAGYPYIYVETDGAHQWRNWRRYLADFARRLFR